MKSIKNLIFFFAMGIVAVLFIAADHIDAPSVSGTTSDIADYYAFQNPNDNDKMVFVATLQGLLTPSTTTTARFDENVLIEFNIDNDGDQIEDLVIQLIPRDGKMYAFGPYPPVLKGKMSEIDDSMAPVSVDITEYGNQEIVAESNGVKLFAGPRDDPFFFDLGAYMDILSGNSPGFGNPGNDTFAGTNVLAAVIEVPKSTLGSSSTLNTWIETKVKL